MRKSCKVFIEIDLEKALQDGLEFFISSNKVILSNGIENVIIPVIIIDILIQRNISKKSL